MSIVISHFDFRKIVSISLEFRLFRTSSVKIPSRTEL